MVFLILLTLLVGATSGFLVSVGCSVLDFKAAILEAIEDSLEPLESGSSITILDLGSGTCSKLDFKAAILDVLDEVSVLVTESLVAIEEFTFGAFLSPISAIPNNADKGSTKSPEVVRFVFVGAICVVLTGSFLVLVSVDVSGIISPKREVLKEVIFSVVEVLGVDSGISDFSFSGLERGLLIITSDFCSVAFGVSLGFSGSVDLSPCGSTTSGFVSFIFSCSLTFGTSFGLKLSSFGGSVSALLSISFAGCGGVVFFLVSVD